MKSMQINNMSLNKWVYKFYQTHGKDIIAVFLLTDKQVLENLILWLDMGLIRESSLSLVNKFSEESQTTKIKIKNMKLMFQCLKFTMKKFKICLSQLTKETKRDIRSENIKHWEFMLKDFQSIMLIPIKLLRKK